MTLSFDELMNLVPDLNEPRAKKTSKSKTRFKFHRPEQKKTRFIDISDWSHSVKGYDNNEFVRYPIKYVKIQLQEQENEEKRQALLHKKNGLLVF